LPVKLHAAFLLDLADQSRQEAGAAVISSCAPASIAAIDRKLSRESGSCNYLVNETSAPRRGGRAAQRLGRRRRRPVGLQRGWLG
jgi:hypothetical protein